MDSIYGIDIPEKDKKALLEYIFKPDADGITRYQKDYAKSLKNLITSAYFTMKGDTLIDIAKKKGKKMLLIISRIHFLEIMEYLRNLKGK